MAAVAKTVRITVDQSNILQQLFQDDHYENYDKNLLKLSFETIIKHPNFNTLKLSQIQRCFTQYEANLKLASNIGRKFSKTTLDIRNDKDLIKNFAVITLSHIFKVFKSDAYNALPNTFNKFLKRVDEYFRTKLIHDDKFENNNILFENDHLRINSFAGLHLLLLLLLFNFRIY